MLNNFSITSVLLIACCGVACAQEKPTDAPQESATEVVEMFFAAENVPEGLTPKTVVNLTAVAGKTVTTTGVRVRTVPIVPGITVASLSKLEKPTEPEKEVKVEFSVDKDQAARIKKAQEKRITVVELVAPGRPKETIRGLLFRLELPKPTGEK